jgi:hypothetical protein
LTPAGYATCFDLSNLVNGAHDEDTLPNPLNHFYNPATFSGLKLWMPSELSDGIIVNDGITFGNARDRAEWFMSLANRQMSRSRSTGSYNLGRALHLVQDMAAPSHAQAASHKHQSDNQIGYEWWVTKNWYDGFKIEDMLNNYYTKGWLTSIRAGDIGGYIHSMATSTYSSGYAFDYDTHYEEGHGNIVTLNDEQSRYNAFFLIPSIVRLGAGFLKTFCEYNAISRPSYRGSSPGGAHPDDNFDVSSRFIQLEELDITKQGWKDLYGRTGIKKGYNGLFLEKIISEAYVNSNEIEFAKVVENASRNIKHSIKESYYASADVSILSEGFVDNAAELLVKRLNEPIREINETFIPSLLLSTQSVLVIPSGGLDGYENTSLLKASLDEYVKQGGTLIVLSQKHGYDYASIPTPDGKPITGYGWEEDQNCFADSVAIESWHQMLSGQSRSTPTLNVDGYFTGYPANSTVLLRRTANGQPA